MLILICFFFDGNKEIADRFPVPQTQNPSLSFLSFSKKKKKKHRRTVDHTATYLSAHLSRGDAPDDPWSGSYASSGPNAPALDATAAAAAGGAASSSSSGGGSSSGTSGLLPPASYVSTPAAAAATKFVHMSVNKARCSVNAVVWTPEGRRCLSATAGGEFTLWNGATFGFATILQAHESPIRAVRFSHNDNWMVSCDDAGAVKYWRPNLELVKAIQAHREPVRAVAFAPTDLKFATASDDATIRIWDFARCASDVTLAGHGGDAKAVDWHSTLGLVASGAKDSLVKLWDPRAKSTGAGGVVSSAPSNGNAAAAPAAASSSSGGSLASLSGHTAAITAVAFAPHAPHWLLSCSRDSTARLVDIRTLRPLATLTGHGRDVTCCAWHPWSPSVVATGAYDGGMAFWDVTAGDSGGGGGGEGGRSGAENQRAAAASSGAFAGKGKSAALGSSPAPIAMVPGAHEASLWSIAWHPAGHLAAKLLHPLAQEGPVELIVLVHRGP